MSTFLGNRYRPHDPVWHAQIAMLVAIILQLILPDRYVLGSRYALIAGECVLLLALSFTTPKERVFKSLSRRINVILLLALTSITNAYSLATVAQKLLEHGHINNGRELILVAINIYLTNIIIFALWYWEMDGGGPGERQAVARYQLDFYFPQHQNELIKHPEWKPTFVDYLYVSSTNAMAFSPTDTMPLSRRAKLLMLTQASISLIAVALVAARAVNILS